MPDPEPPHATPEAGGTTIPPTAPTGPIADPAGPRGGYREVTVAAILFAVVIGVVMNAAITYAGLKIGFTIGGSAIAAVLGFGVLRGILRKGTILETNIAQTAASAINTSNSGVIFTVPVLLLLGYQLSVSSVDFWLITLACLAGAILGTAFIIPLRKQMIDIDRLRFPTGTGVAVILKSPGAGAAKSVVLVGGILIGMLIFLPVGLPQLGDTLVAKAAAAGQTSGLGEALAGFSYTNLGNALFGGGQHVLVGEEFNAGHALGLPAQFELIFAVAPFAIGAGFITGRPGLLVLAGGILAYFVLTPVAYAMGWMPGSVSAAEAPGYGFQAFNRPLGIGLLLGGAMMGVVSSLPAIREALKSVAASRKTGGGSDELSIRPLIFAAIGALVLLFVAADFTGSKPLNAGGFDPVTQVQLGEQTVESEYKGYNLSFTGEDTRTEFASWTPDQKDGYLATQNAKPGLLSGLPSHVRAAIIAVVGALWIWFAGIIIAQCTGMTDWSPISGMALLTVVLIMLLAGTGSVVGAVLIGAALCVAITLAADMMSDLRTGHLVGGLPRRQQMVELGVVWIGPAIAMLTVIVIAGANLKLGGPAIGPGAPNGAVAPQAQALQAVITGVQGGEMPYALYGFGALLGALLGIGAFSGLGVLVGLSMYLPFQYIATYGIGCIVQMVLSKTAGRRWCEEWGVPMAAGLIVGESILALVINFIVLIVG